MSERPPFLGLGGRLTEPAAAELVVAGFAAEMADARLLHDGFGLADLAHLLALDDLGALDVVAAPERVALFDAVLGLVATRAADFPYDPADGDPWNSRERHLEAMAGPVAGWLTVGRPRREAARVASRLALRRALLDADDALAGLGEAYLAQAGRHRNTLMADATYLQPAQPTTLGYVLAGHLQPVLRHLARLERAWDWLNRSPGGAGGTTGSSLPLDRERLAARLGFDAVAPHCRDAMWQTDGFVELLAVLSSAATEAGQVAADLEVWASPAFGFVELDDRYCRVSALMPQKKNPYALPVVRHAAGTLAGSLTGLLSVLRTGTARTDHFLSLSGDVARALAIFSGATELLTGVVGTMSVDGQALSSSAADPGLVLADVADEVVWTGGGSRRAVHRLLGQAARRAAGEGRPVTAADVAAALAGAGIDLPAPARRWLDDPAALLGKRSVTGGWTALPELLSTAERELARHQRACARRRAAVEAAESGLVAQARSRLVGRRPCDPA